MDRGTKAVEAVALAPTKPLVAAADRSGAIKLWNSHTGDLLKTLVSPNTSVLSLAFSPDSTLLLSGDNRGALRLWNVESGEALYSLPALDGSILTCSFSPDGDYLLAGGHGTAYLWDTHNWRIFHKFEGYYDLVGSWFAPDGHSLFLSNGQGGWLHWLDTQTGQTSLKWDVTDAAVTALACTKDNQTLFVWDSMKISVWELPSGKFVRTLADNSPYSDDRIEYVFKGALAANETFLTAVGLNGVVVTLDLSGNVIQRFAGHSDAVFALAISADDSSLLTGSMDGTARFWDIRSGTELQRFVP